MNRLSIVVLSSVMTLSMGLAAFANPDLTHGQETFHKWVQVYDRQPDTVFVDQASIHAKKPPKAEATLMKHHEPSAAMNGTAHRTEVNHVKVNCKDNTYSVRFQAEYMPNGTLTKTQSFDEHREFVQPTSDTYFQDVIDFVCGQIKFN